MGNRATWMLGGIAVWLACGSSASLPADLLGLWQHPDPAHADRSLEIRPDRIIFGVGGGDHDAFPISSIDAEPDGAATVFTVEYRQVDGARIPLRLRFTPGPNPELRLGRREGVWRPARATHAAAREEAS